MKKIITIIVVASLVGISYVLLNKNNTNSAEINTTSINNKDMSFFITSTNPGNGGNLGGLDGADKYCATLAENAGIKNKTWKAFLSTTNSSELRGEDARDRIGNGPWKNFKGEVVANNLNELMSNNLINKQTALNENGEIVFGRGDTPNSHDILTGSTELGIASSTDQDTTCSNWTSNATGSAIVGHHDRIGINDSPAMKSWSTSHLTRGCSVDNFKSTGGAGLFYCFAK
jgi:hypothetical protein